MKKFIIYTVLSLGLVFQGCSDFLEEVPLSEISPANYYKTPEQAESAVVSTYIGLKSSAVTGWEIKTITSDMKRAAGYDNREGIGTYTFSPLNSVIAKIWRHHYAAIKNCNSVVDYVSLDLENGARVHGEARFIRAYLYFQLVQWFGDVPLRVTEVASLNELSISKSTEAQVYEQIVKDLEYALENTGIKSEVAYGKVTQDAAAALLAKVYLTMGNNEQRNGLGDGKSYFQKSVDYAKMVIDNGRYSLLDFYPDNFIREEKGNEEIIFMVQFLPGDELGGFVGAHMGIGQNTDLGGSWTSIYATDYYASIFEESDSIRRFWNVEKAKIGKVNGEGVYQSYENEDYYPGNFSGGVMPNWPPFHIGKFRRFPVRAKDSYTFQYWDMDEPLIRYAEVLLIYAEALNEVNDGPTTEAYDAVNLVRNRARNHNVAGDAGIREDIFPRTLVYEAGAVPDWADMSYQEFAEAILDERAKELVGEGCTRWFDLKRKGLLVEKVRKLKTYLNPITNKVEPDWAAGDNISEKHYVLPIPQEEIDYNPDVKPQNPGY